MFGTFTWYDVCFAWFEICMCRLATIRYSCDTLDHWLTHLAYFGQKPIFIGFNGIFCLLRAGIWMKIDIFVSKTHIRILFKCSMFCQSKTISVRFCTDSMLLSISHVWGEYNLALSWTMYLFASNGNKNEENRHETVMHYILTWPKVLANPLEI